jgi:hypothetical protein
VHLGADLFDDAHELVTDAVRLFRGGDAAIGPQIGPADARGDDTNDRVGTGGQDGIGDVLDADVAGGVDDSGELETSLGP